MVVGQTVCYWDSEQSGSLSRASESGVLTASLTAVEKLRRSHASLQTPSSC